MSHNRRNIMVGATVLLALASLAWMILQFGGDLARPFSPEQIRVTFHADRADGLSSGSAISYLGVDVGRVSRVQLGDRGVVIEAMINRQPPLPADLRGIIRANSYLGGSTNITLENGADDAGVLEPGAVLTARFVPLSILPPEVDELARDLREIVGSFRESELLGNIDRQVLKLGELLESLNLFFSDQQLREDIRVTVAQVRQLTETAREVAVDVERFTKRLDELSDKAAATLVAGERVLANSDRQVEQLSRDLADRTAQLARLLDQLNTAAAKLNQPDNTVGLLLNDRQLYLTLVNTTRQLELALEDARRLIQQWEQEGVPLRLR